MDPYQVRSDPRASAAAGDGRATYDVKPGQTIALTGLLNDEIVQQLRRSAGAADEDLLLKQLIDARTAKAGTDLVLLVTPELIESSGPTR